MIIRLVLGKDDVNALQAAMYMKDSKKDILCTVVGNKFMSINPDLFDKYCNEYTEAYMEYECYKDEINRKYLGKLYEFKASINWDLDFSSCIMKINIDGVTKEQLEEAGYDVEE